MSPSPTPRRKEDLIEDATGLVDRAEFQGPPLNLPLVAGFRRQPALSLYFGEDPVFHFNTSGQLRRAFVAGVLYKADRGRLVRMVRYRQQGHHELVSRELTEAEQQRFLDDLHQRLQFIQASLADGQLVMTRSVCSTGTPVPEQLRQWLDAHLETLTVASRAHVA